MADEALREKQEQEKLAKARDQAKRDEMAGWIRRTFSDPEFRALDSKDKISIMEQADPEFQSIPDMADKARVVQSYLYQVPKGMPSTGSAWRDFAESFVGAAMQPVYYGGELVRRGEQKLFGKTGEKLEEMAERGTVYRADTLEGLSCKLGMRPGALAVLAAQVNRDVDAGGRDTRCLKSAEHLAPIRRAPFYAARMRPAVVGTTHTGLRTDTVGRVIGEDGSAIPGLYAAGEIVGNILGDRYVGGGNSLSNSFVFGRLAGESASSFARKLE